ncbi:hypothetical protein Tco_0016776 [Tanacetum coccineum]
MAITNFCNKHNMIACVEKTERNADFHEVIDFLTGCSVNYALWNLKDSKPFLMYPSPKFSGKLTPLTPPMLEVATAVRADHSLHTEELDIPTSSHHSDDSSAGKKAESPSPVASERPASPNDYTPTDEVQTSGGDEGNLDLYGLTREVLKLKKQNAKQAAQILRLKTKLKILVKKVKPGRKESSDGSTGLNEVDVNSGDSQMMDVDDNISAEVNKGTAEVNEGTAEVNESTAGANLNESDEFIQDDTLIADVLVNITRPRRGAGITIPGNIPEQERPESPTLILDPKDKGKVAAEWEEEEERKRLAGLERLQAELEDYEMIVAEVQRTERENFTEEQKAKFLVETIAAQRRFRAEQQAALKEANLLPFPAKRIRMYEVKRFNDKFVAIGSTEDEQAIKEMNVKLKNLQKKKKRYPLTRELMQRMLEHKLEVQRETEDALNLIRFVMKQKEDLEREEE